MTTDTETTLARAEDPPIVKLLKAYAPDVEAALPDGWSPERFQATCINLLRHTPKLKDTTPMSFVSSVMLGAQLGLEPGPPLGLSWIIPRNRRFKDRSGQWQSQMEASFQIGYAGYRDLAMRSGYVDTIEAHIVHEGDDFDYDWGIDGPAMRWKPEGTPGRDWSHVFAVARMVSGGRLLEVWSKAEGLAHRDKYVKDWERTAWKDEEPKMARKSVLAALCRQLPVSVEVRQAMAADGSAPRVLSRDLAGVLALTSGDEEAE